MPGMWRTFRVLTCCCVSSLAWAQIVPANETEVLSIKGNAAVVAGGVGNLAAGKRSAVGGGRDNTAEGIASVVSGGFTNSAVGDYSTVSGGWRNEASGYVGTVGGGWENKATGLVATVSGGQYNEAGAAAATVGGGWKNIATGAGAVVPGGRNNRAFGSYSFAAGHKAVAGHEGSFVWADAGEEDFVSTAENQFLIQAAGNVGIDVNNPAEKLTVAGTIAPGGDAVFSLGSSALRWTVVHLSEGLAYEEKLTFKVGDTVTLELDATGNLTLPGTLDAGAITIQGQPLVQSGAVEATESIGPDDLAQLDKRYVLSADADSDTWTARVKGMPVIRVQQVSESPNVVLGHSENMVSTTSMGATIGGGGRKAKGNLADGNFSVVSGGTGNEARGSYTTIGGGIGNLVYDSGTTVAGGIGNVATNWNVTVGGGRENVAAGLGASIGGGRGNVASNRYTVIPGGYFNTASGSGAVIGGGFANVARGFISTIPGGSQNEAAGEYSLAAGRRAGALHDGTFVWADGRDEAFTSSVSNQVLFRAENGVGIGTSTTPEALNVAGNIAPSASGAHSLGTETLPWKDLYVSERVVAGTVQAARFVGDGSGLTGLTATAEGSTSIRNENIDDDAGIAPAKILGTALTRNSGFSGDIAGPFNKLELAPSSVTSAHIQDGSITERDLNLDDLDERYALKAELSAVTADVPAPSPVLQADVVGSAEVKDGSLQLQDIHIEQFDSRYLTKEEHGNLLNALSAAEDGRVGIGTGDPAATLDVNGTVRASRFVGDASGLTNWTMVLPSPELSEESVNGKMIADGSIRLADVDLQEFDARYKVTRTVRKEAEPQADDGGVSDMTLGTKVAPHDVDAAFGTVAGGEGNRVDGEFGTVSGGQSNQAIGDRASVGGGRRNIAGGAASVVAGGFTNSAGGNYAFIGSGWANEAHGYVSTIAGGWANQATGAVSAIAGGQDNRASGSATVVGGGWNNEASGFAAAVPGGKANVAGGEYSVAMGHRAKANHPGTFVWNGGADQDLASTADGQFLIGATGNVGINTATPEETLSVGGNIKAEGTVVAASFSGDGSQLTGLPSAELSDRAVTAEKLADGAVALKHLAPEVMRSLGERALEASLNTEQDVVFSKTVTAGSFVGSGSGLTEIPAASVKGLTIADEHVKEDAAINPTKISGTALVQSDAFAGDISGTFRDLTIAQGAVGLDELSPDVREQLDRPATMSAVDELNVVGSVRAARLEGNGAGLTDIPFSALNLAPGVLDGSLLAAGSVTADHLAEGVLVSAGRESTSWRVGGNRPEDERPKVLGTRNAAPVHIYVNGQPVLRLASRDGTSGNLLGGHVANKIASEASGAVVAGGGDDGAPNVAGHNFAVVSGGMNNEAGNEFATVGGGLGNRAVGFDATISGGQDNLAQGSGATVAGGFTNLASGSFSTVSGGAANRASGNVGAVGGGFGNQATGSHATVPGGSLNEASGDYSLASGRRAKARHAGSFIWADGTDSDVESKAANQFLARASGGFYLYSDAAQKSGVKLDAGAGSWSMLSDVSAKDDFRVVDAQQVLDALVKLPIQQWTYASDETGAIHLGPTAQDFHAAFALGSDRTHITGVDAHGVALAAIQGLHQNLTEKDQRLADLERENRELRSQVRAIQAQLDTWVQDNRRNE